MKNKLIISFAFVLVFGISAFAQTGLEIYKADLSVPFGEAEGKVLAVGDQLVFIDDDKTEFSFAIARNNISGVASDGNVLTVETKQAVQDRSGMKSRFVMRVADGGAEKLAQWLKGGSISTASIEPNNSNTNMSTTSTMVYEAKHAHRLYGSCSGRLVISDDRISYESSDDREHSRQWLMTDIKKVQSKSPYKFEVKLFKGDGYALEISGKGVDITDFKVIQDKVAVAKASR